MSWKYTLQATFALSMAETKYMAATEVAKKALSLKCLIEELKIHQGGVSLLCDNLSAICLAKN